MRQVIIKSIQILQFAILLSSIGCTNPSSKSLSQIDVSSHSQADPFLNVSKTNFEKKQTPVLTNDITANSKYFSNYGLSNVVSDIKGGRLNSTDLILFLTNSSDSINIGFEFCTAGGKSYFDCEKALNNVDLGFGLCMLIPENDYYDCYYALGQVNTGYGLCMTVAGNDYYDCYYALGKENLGYGLCMTGNGNDYYDCYYALNKETTGYGICMTGNGNDYFDCYYALNGNNTGYGFCMTGKGKDYFDCYKSLGAENVGFGLCMIHEENDYYDCDEALGNDNVSYGECIASGRDAASCSYYLEPSLSSSSDFILTLGGVKGSINKKTIFSTDVIKINLDLRVNNPKINSLASVYVVASVSLNGTQTFYHKNGTYFEVWDGEFSTLKPYLTNVKLETYNSYSIFNGSLKDIKGDVKLYYGYLYNGSGMDQLQYNKTKDISFKVQ